MLTKNLIKRHEIIKQESEKIKDKSFQRLYRYFGSTYSTTVMYNLIRLGRKADKLETMLLKLDKEG